MIIMIDTFEIIKNKKSILFIGLYIVLLIISSLNIRFNYYYQCDDYKGVYNYLKEENKDYDYIFTYENEIYNNKNIISKEHYRAIKKEKDKEIINDFNQNENAVLVLFEKNVSKSLYNYFDESNEYLVNSKYNSFKIVKHRSENEELD